MRRADYERKADEAVQEYVDQGTPLESTIVKIARRDSLNPEQIKRLVEMANTGTFLELFKKTSGEEDRVINFDVADPESVIESFYSASPEAREKAASYSEPVPDFHFFKNVVSEVDGYSPVDITKVASPGDESYLSAPSESWQVELERKRKVASSLEDKICTAEITAGDIADKLASEFRGIYSRENYPEFEKNALALHGLDSLIALTAVRRRLGMPKISSIPSREAVKSASERYIVDSSSKGMQEIEEYLKCAHIVSECSSALEIVSDRVHKLQWGKHSG